MTKARYDIAPQFERAEIRRQRYLDFLHANPGSLSTDIDAYMLETYGDTAKSFNTTRQLLALNEIMATKTSRVWRYYATAITTTPAKVFSDKQKEAARKRMHRMNGTDYIEPEKPVAGKTDSLGCARYVHSPSHVHSTGGQGAVRERVWAGTSGALNW